MFFHRIWVLGARGGGGGPKGLVHNPLMQLFTLDKSKIKVFEFFFDTVITLNDPLRYVKHVLGCIYFFFTLFGYWVCGGGGGGGGQGIGTQPAYAVVHPRQLKKQRFRNFLFAFRDHPKSASQARSFA